LELQPTLSRFPLHLSQVRDQRCDWQSSILSLESGQLASGRQKAGQAGAAWNPQPSNSLPKIKARGGSTSRRRNRKQANQLRGKINQFAREKAFAGGTVTVEVNPHGTSQYCSRCGAKGERFSSRGGKRIGEKWGKLFWCSHCRYEANADFNASANVHHSFYNEWHWQRRPKRGG
jgi:putative transposase-like DNA-binding protein